ncbi:MAG: hypothetical protein IT384_04015 [Deltaproteobacteria bacterium]|nr:hypothetical protein [Deltaproteobacteria bacterium]
MALEPYEPPKADLEGVPSELRGDVEVALLKVGERMQLIRASAFAAVVALGTLGVVPAFGVLEAWAFDRTGRDLARGAAVAGALSSFLLAGIVGAALWSAVGPVFERRVLVAVARAFKVDRDTLGKAWVALRRR